MTYAIRPLGRSSDLDKLSMRLAAIDVGSNSIHMIIAQADSDDAITTLWRMKEMVGLGRLSFPSKNLSRDAINRALVTLGRFKQAAEQRQCEKILTVATSAVREATNGGELIDRAREELNLEIRVVSAREEARLIYLAVRHAFPLKRQPKLMVDIGGGSVEFIVGNEEQATLLESRKLGAARLTAQYVKSDPINDADLSKLRKHLDTELSKLFDDIHTQKPFGAIGTSGTIDNIAAMCTARSGKPEIDGKRVIQREVFEKLLKRVISSNSEEREKIEGLDDQRKDQILAGMLVVDEVFKRLNLKEIELCDGALREGIVLDYLERHAPDLSIRREMPDPRRRSVFDLARKCLWHQTHSEQVTRLCLRLFDQLRPLHGLGPIDRELIEYASLLHDIGWHVGSQDHHKHSAYLIQHGRLKQFSPEEIQVIAQIARYHRKSPPKATHESYMELPRSARRTIDVGSALLRLADGLDRSHASMIQDVRAKIDKKKVELKLSARGDAALEVWGAQRKAEWFEKVFDRGLEVTV